MDNMLKRLLSLAIALVMVIGLMPWNAVSAYATEAVPAEATPVAEGDVASIGDVGYETLEAALAAAKETEDADTIKLLADVVTVNAQLAITSDITITADKAVTMQVERLFRKSMPALS